MRMPDAPKGMAHGQQAAVGVDGNITRESGAAFGGGLPCLAEGEQVQGLDLLQLADGGGVVDLAEVNVFRPQAAHLVGLQGRRFGAVGAESGMIGAAPVVFAGGQHRRGDGHGPALVYPVLRQ